ncbi:MAG: peptidylprolyl isomerase, partial [Planctomycetia bacterium]|nr:peptidylprolyl isomerase [Planctomycetia bacterium]
MIDLEAAFDLAGVTGTVVRFSNNVGADIYAELFDAAGPARTRTTPLTAANFLAYLDAGRYTNTIMHRSVSGFVVQGGGFTDKSLSAAIPQFPAVTNEPGNTNTRGTIAMA